MAGSTRDLGVGITAVWTTSGFTAEIKNLTWGEASRDSHEVTHQGTPAAGAGKFGNRVYLESDLQDPGTVSFDMHFDPDTVPPIGLAQEILTITWPLVSGDSTAATWVGTVFCMTYEPAITLGEVMVQTSTWKVSGNVTVSAAT